MLGVSNAAPNAHRPPYEWPTTSTGAPGLIGHRVGDRGQVLVLALDRVGRPIAGGASAAPVDGMQTESALEDRSDGSPRGVIGRRAVNEQERRSLTGGEDRDRRPVGRYDAPLNGRHGRQR